MTSVIRVIPGQRYARIVAAQRRKIARRTGDQTQRLRRGVQLAFLVLNVWIGWQFYAFVRYCETEGQTTYVPRPAAVDGWLPIAGLMNLKYALTTWSLPQVHAAGLFLFVAFIGVSFIFRKAFCSWLCPVGTVSEWLWQGGRELLRRDFIPPKWVDIPLRSLKYILLGLFAYAIARMPAEEIAGFMGSPFGLTADVKLLDFFREISTTAAIVVAALVVGSLFVKNLWCRYLCPYGALMGIVALGSPVRIRRNPLTCIDCDKCSKACPSYIPVAQLLRVNTSECTGCLECVSACPIADSLELGLRPTSRRVPGWAVAAGVVLLFVGIVGYAKATHHWQDQTPETVYFHLIPASNGVAHFQ